MKNLFNIIFITFSLSIFAQKTEILSNTTWVMEEHYSLNSNNSKTSFYKRGNTNNIHNFDKFKYDFKTSGEVTLKLNDTIQQDKKWKFSTNKDSLYIDNSRYKIEALNEDILILKNGGTLYGLTFDYYLILKPLGILSTNKNEKNATISISPVPSKDKIQIHLNNIEKSINSVCIYTLDGRKLKTYMLNNRKKHTISIKDLSKGMYLINFLDENKVILDTKKIIKQ